MNAEARRNLLLFLFVVVAATATLAAPAARAQAPRAEPRVESRGELDFGYRSGEFDWNIAGTPEGTEPNVLSELDWTDIEVLQLRLGGELVFARHLWLGGSVTSGRIQSGRNRDSDYLGDNRTLEFSRSENGANDGDVLDADLGLGYLFRVPARASGPGFDILLAGGYAIARQDLRILDGVQTIADEDIFGAPLPATGPFEGLNSSYDAEWDGPWLGAEARIGLSERARLTGRVRAHRADFAAQANWNLRDDFAHPVSFEHSAEGDGLALRAAYSRRTRSRWGWQIGLDYQRWTTDAGLDRVYFSDGTSLDTRLNEANWSSLALTLGITLGR